VASGSSPTGADRSSWRPSSSPAESDIAGRVREDRRRRDADARRRRLLLARSGSDGWHRHQRPTASLAVRDASVAIDERMGSGPRATDDRRPSRSKPQRRGKRRRANGHALSRPLEKWTTYAGLKVDHLGDRRRGALRPSARQRLRAWARRSPTPGRSKPLNITTDSQRDAMPETTLTPKSVRITEDRGEVAERRGHQGRCHPKRSASPRAASSTQGAGGGQPDQARNCPRYRGGVQVQAHPASRGGRQGDLGLQGAVRRVRQREGDAGESCPAYSRYASSRQLSASSRAGLRRSRKRCARPGEGACSAR
jgi:hypothetical protein